MTHPAHPSDSCLIWKIFRQIMHEDYVPITTAVEASLHFEEEWNECTFPDGMIGVLCLADTRAAIYVLLEIAAKYRTNASEHTNLYLDRYGDAVACLYQYARNEPMALSCQDLYARLTLGCEDLFDLVQDGGAIMDGENNQAFLFVMAYRWMAAAVKRDDKIYRAHYVVDAMARLAATQWRELHKEYQLGQDTKDEIGRKFSDTIRSLTGPPDIMTVVKQALR